MYFSVLSAAAERLNLRWSDRQDLLGLRELCRVEMEAIKLRLGYYDCSRDDGALLVFHPSQGHMMQIPLSVHEVLVDTLP
jgi:hypothetical protein